MPRAQAWLPGDDVYVYDAQHYLVVSVPVPFTMETDASEAEPMLAVYMRLDLQVASELMLQVDEALRAQRRPAQGDVCLADGRSAARLDTAFSRGDECSR